MLALWSRIVDVGRQILPSCVHMRRVWATLRMVYAGPGSWRCCGGLSWRGARVRCTWRRSAPALVQHNWIFLLHQNFCILSSKYSLHATYHMTPLAYFNQGLPTWHLH